ncbi:MAG: hypothetical protein OWQ48_05915 [Desulfurococcus sp.]|nr:hypothetical protein [Desulfurococcus sp.]
MTIYWERCSFCGSYEPVLQCTLFPDMSVDAKCCLSCPKRSVCPRPAWSFRIPAARRHSEESESSSQSRKKLLDLLERIEEEQKKSTV